jgi:hypothetical protein
MSSRKEGLEDMETFCLMALNFFCSSLKAAPSSATESYLVLVLSLDMDIEAWTSFLTEVISPMYPETSLALFSLNFLV